MTGDAVEFFQETASASVGGGRDRFERSAVVTEHLMGHRFSRDELRLPEQLEMGGLTGDSRVFDADGDAACRQVKGLALGFAVQDQNPPFAIGRVASGARNLKVPLPSDREIGSDMRVERLLRSEVKIG